MLQGPDYYLRLPFTGLKRRRNLANRGINGWFSILIGRYKLQDHMSMDTALVINRHIHNFKNNKMQYFYNRGFALKFYFCLYCLCTQSKSRPDQLMPQGSQFVVMVRGHSLVFGQ